MFYPKFVQLAFLLTFLGKHFWSSILGLGFILRYHVTPVLIYIIPGYVQGACKPERYLKEFEFLILKEHNAVRNQHEVYLN